LIEETQLTLDAASSDHSAEPARVLVCGDVPELRREDRVRELRDLNDISQAGDGE